MTDYLQKEGIHALISDIVKHTYNDFEATKPRSFSNDCQVVKETLKVAYAVEANLPDDFSTAKLSKIQARDFISSIIEFCFQFDIPLSASGLQMTDDIN
ncbi:hypothetical protein HB834_17885, partial [Listeria booriae]|nr:hypothetical protein [Listeria booriae]